MTTINFKTEGVCAKYIQIELDDDIIKNANFIGGCAGNALGINALISGMTVDEAIKKLEGIQCGNKGTSCPDQFSKALKQYKDGK